MATALFPLPSLPNHHPHTVPTEHPHVSQPPTEEHHDTRTNEHSAHNAPVARDDDSDSNLGTGVDLGTLTGRRITLKPRRTLSLSPTPGNSRDTHSNTLSLSNDRVTCWYVSVTSVSSTFPPIWKRSRTGDMSMGRNLRAARCLDFTDKDDDDGLYQPSDSESEGAKKKGDAVETNPANGLSLKERFLKSRGPLGASLSSKGIHHRQSVSVKRPLDVVLPCQEIQYLDICYQKVQFSPIPRKKISYHPVLHNSIHYCDVPYCGSDERPIKRKPLQRSHSIAVAGEKVGYDWTSSYKLR
ncbi:uncharacterized protein LOC135197946 isoform X2 [Macrobrachium nipponense]|uniref:uncharacterized protein LOC135197946 isoform X2 n=1 Tax=Macrobrachium nipponense TaxID=159736 RepID=UPI0030C80615